MDEPAQSPPVMDTGGMVGAQDVATLQSPPVIDQGGMVGAQDVAALQSLSQPVCIIVLGMAGTGKTTLINRLTSHLYSQGTPPYVMNLDPACKEVPYPANIGWPIDNITCKFPWGFTVSVNKALMPRYPRGHV